MTVPTAHREPTGFEHLPLAEQIALLAGARQAQAQLKAQFKAAYQLFEQQMAITIAALATAKIREDHLDDLVRRGAVATYQASGDKHPAPGTLVFEADAYEVVDPAALLAATLKLAKKVEGIVAPNHKLVQSLLEAGQHISGARMVSVPKVRLDSDLFAALSRAQVLEAPARARRAGQRARGRGVAKVLAPVEAGTGGSSDLALPLDQAVEAS